MTVLGIGTTSSVINFNDGRVWTLRVLTKLVIILGSNSICYCNKRDKGRIYQMNMKEMDLVKHQRRQTRAIREGFGDQDEEKERKIYGTGEP